MAESMDDHFFKDMCVHAGVALIGTDEHLNIRFWNPAATRMLGGSAEAMLGQPIQSILPAERREMADRLLERTLARGEISEFEFQHRNPAGQPTYLAVTLSPVIDSTGRRIGISVYVRDVTRRMELERKMADSRKMSALGAMAGQVAHHFNNVLGGIITSLDFVQDSDDAIALRRSMRMAVSALTRANSLTQGLLAFAEGDRCASDLVDMAELVRQFAARLEPRLRAQSITLEQSIEPTTARLPGRQITTVLENLTSNAREAMPQGGTLRIELKHLADGQRVALRISDTGCGICAENQHRLFEPFFTTKSQAPSDLNQHAGLGLAVVHGIVKDLGGEVTLSSQTGCGTTCSVTLPCDWHALK